MTDLKEFRKKALTDAAVRAEYDALAPAFEIAREFIRARARAGLTQQELADRMQTTQSTIARLESGRGLPSMRTLARFAKATGTRPVITFVPVDGASTPNGAVRSG